MAQISRWPFMDVTIGPPGLPRQGPMPLFGRFCAPNAPRAGALWLIIFNHWGLSSAGIPPFDRCGMRFLLLAGAFALGASAAFADTRVFIVANQADGYGVDQCLAQGEKCGAHAARAYCQQRDFAQAVSYRRVDPEEITGAVPKNVTGRCGPAGCNEYVAITCER